MYILIAIILKSAQVTKCIYVDQRRLSMTCFSRDQAKCLEESEWSAGEYSC